MTTMNISVTKEQAKLVDQIAKKFNFSNRSELFRSLLRMIQQQPHLITQSSVLPFQSPPTRSRSKVLQGLKKTGLYTPEFLTDMENGMKDSLFFSEK